MSPPRPGASPLSPAFARWGLDAGGAFGFQGRESRGGQHRFLTVPWGSRAAGSAGLAGSPEAWAGEVPADLGPLPVPGFRAASSCGLCGREPRLGRLGGFESRFGPSVGAGPAPLPGAQQAWLEARTRPREPLPTPGPSDPGRFPAAPGQEGARPPPGGAPGVPGADGEAAEGGEDGRPQPPGARAGRRRKWRSKVRGVGGEAQVGLRPQRRGPWPRGSGRWRGAGGDFGGRLPGLPGPGAPGAGGRAAAARAGGGGAVGAAGGAAASPPPAGRRLRRGRGRDPGGAEGGQRGREEGEGGGWGWSGRSGEP
ncbi:collagen alpha-1(I) chain-like isoform X1 [Nomascus leucogenys]|uniref:collagen alpha-1(I) chain-like isoform X1 n=1 Tax=Nomascus leucogenys TaxID=61853 RepID=UPI00122D9903|nr:collagen alpha-1(I) chain-like isoform X1 [Nomascus leucogenys]